MRKALVGKPSRISVNRFLERAMGIERNAHWILNDFGDFSEFSIALFSQHKRF
jgi:hypothetical protein